MEPDTPPNRRPQAARPSYYWTLVRDASGEAVSVECLALIEALGLNFNTGNTFKYLWRAGRKTSEVAKDLRKAREYLDREILRLEREAREDEEGADRHAAELTRIADAEHVAFAADNVKQVDVKSLLRRALEHEARETEAAAAAVRHAPYALAERRAAAHGYGTTDPQTVIPHGVGREHE